MKFNGLTHFFIRLGAIAGAAAAVIALAGMLSSISTAKVVERISHVEVAVNRLADVMEVGIAAIAESDSLQRAVAIEQLRRMRTVTGRMRIEREEPNGRTAVPAE